MSLRALAWPLLCLALLSGGCSQPYKVGDYVLVEWEEGKLYPAYITEVTKSRYRVHFEGYDSRWDDDFGIDRIKGRVEGPVVPPPPPEKVARASRPAAAAAAAAAEKANAADGGVPSPSSVGSVALAVNQFKPGDRVRVTWRGSIYSAVVLEIVAQDRVLLHYEGHENVWDEVVQIERIVSRRQ